MSSCLWVIVLSSALLWGEGVQTGIKQACLRPMANACRAFYATTTVEGIGPQDAILDQCSAPDPRIVCAASASKSAIHVSFTIMGDIGRRSATLRTVKPTPAVRKLR